jgi:hypothetical protein
MPRITRRSGRVVITAASSGVLYDSAFRAPTPYDEAEFGDRHGRRLTPSGAGNHANIRVIMRTLERPLFGASER